MQIFSGGTGDLVLSILAIIIAGLVGWIAKLAWDTKPDVEEVEDKINHAIIEERRVVRDREQAILNVAIQAAISSERLSDREQDKEMIQPLIDNQRRIDIHMENNHKEGLERFTRLENKFDELQKFIQQWHSLK